MFLRERGSSWRSLSGHRPLQRHHFLELPTHARGSLPAAAAKLKGQPCRAVTCDRRSKNSRTMLVVTSYHISSQSHWGPGATRSVYFPYRGLFCVDAIIHGLFLCVVPLSAAAPACGDPTPSEIRSVDGPRSRVLVMSEPARRTVKGNGTEGISPESGCTSASRIVEAHIPSASARRRASQ